MSDDQQQPEEPNPFQPPDENALPPQLPPPAPLPTAAGTRTPQGKLYNTRQVWLTAVIIMLLIAIVSWFLPPAGLLVPVIFFVALFFLIPAEKTVSYRSGLAGVLIGFGLGMAITAGVCSASLSRMTF